MIIPVHKMRPDIFEELFEDKVILVEPKKPFKDT
jgi:hypothetical protein